MLTGYRLAEKTAALAKKTSGLAHPVRLGCLYLLSFGPKTLMDLASTIDIMPNLAVHHLAILCKGGWVKKEKRGKSVVYTLEPKAFYTWMNFFKEGPLLK
mgnify:CR=1 FL=1